MLGDRDEAQGSYLDLGGPSRTRYEAWVGILGRRTGLKEFSLDMLVRGPADVIEGLLGFLRAASRS